MLRSNNNGSTWLRVTAPLILSIITNSTLLLWRWQGKISVADRVWIFEIFETYGPYDGLTGKLPNTRLTDGCFHPYSFASSKAKHALKKKSAPVQTNLFSEKAHVLFNLPSHFHFITSYSCWLFCCSSFICPFVSFSFAWTSFWLKVI